MEQAIVTAGRIADPTHIELDAPLVGLQGRVELVVRVIPMPPSPKVDLMDFVRALPVGTRTKEDIDSQIREERSAWGD